MIRGVISPIDAWRLEIAPRLGLCFPYINDKTFSIPRKKEIASRIAALGPEIRSHSNCASWEACERVADPDARWSGDSGRSHMFTDLIGSSKWPSDAMNVGTAYILLYMTLRNAFYALMFVPVGIVYDTNADPEAIRIGCVTIQMTFLTQVSGHRRSRPTRGSFCDQRPTVSYVPQVNFPIFEFGCANGRKRATEVALQSSGSLVLTCSWP